MIHVSKVVNKVLADLMLEQQRAVEWHAKYLRKQEAQTEEEAEAQVRRKAFRVIDGDKAA